MIQVTKIVLRVCFVIGAVLVVINMYGLFSSLRNDEIYEENTYFKNDIILTEEQVFDAINAEIDDKKLYVIEVNQAISDGIAHYWDDEGIHTYNLRVPYYENYLLYAASYIKPEIYLKYEFMGYKRAIERGVGLCSQHAIIMAEVLEIAKIPSKIVGLSGHVVVTALVDYNGDEWWIIDPDYGVIIPHSLSDIEQEPQIIVPFYAKRGYDETEILKLVDIYGNDGNVVIDGVGAQNYAMVNYRREKAAYILIWIIPVLCMLPMLICQAIKKK